MLDQHRLRILGALAQHKTMHAVGKALHMSTSAVSQQLSQLEREVGVELLRRAGRRVELTEAGVELAQYATSIASTLEAARARMDSYHAELNATVRVAAFPSFAAAILPGAVTELMANFPKLQLHIADLEPFESLQALRDGRADIAVIDDLQPRPRESQFEYVDVLEDELFLVLNASHDLASPELLDYKEQRWILDGSQDVFGDYVRDLCAQAGFVPHIVAECANITVTLALVNAGFGVSLMSGLHRVHEQYPVRLQPLQPAASRTVTVVTRRSSQANPAVQQSVATIQNQCQNFSNA